MNDKELAAASYVYTFYVNIQQLTDTYSQYINFMIELENKYGESFINKTPEQEKVAVQQTLQTIRHYSNKCYIQLKSMNESIKLKESENFEELYNHIKTTFVIDRNKLEEFVINFNKILVNSIMQNLLQTSQDLIENVYKDNETK